MLTDGQVFIENLQWRFDLKDGNEVDAQDSDRHWYDSRIIEVHKEQNQVKQVKIHFKCWEAKWDEVLGLGDPRLQPLYSRCPQWRDFKVDMQLEVRGQDSKWFKGTITAIDKDSGHITVQTEDRQLTKRVAFNSEDICRLGVHIKTQKQIIKTSVSSVPNGSSRPTPRTTVINPSSSSYTPSLYARGRGSALAAGAVGLSNLGNTCFMNSMLQCLSNTERLTEYFLSGRYQHEINADNPLGMKGKLAITYAQLLKDLWSAEYGMVNPTDFKRVIGQFAPQFAGYQQHDSQELMNFLLDGLHEDLNRVRDKKYVEVKDYDGEPDDLVARQSWRLHLLRNDSVVVDYCQGQLKSHVTCPRCNFDSITFDPYLSLSLPLPVKSTVKVMLTYYPLPLGSTPIKALAVIPSTAQGRDLKQWVSDNLVAHSPAEDGDMMEVDPPQHDTKAIDLTDNYDKRVFAVISDIEPAKDLSKTNISIVAYGLQHDPAKEPGGSVITVLFGKLERRFIYSSFALDRVAMPMRLSITSSTTNHDVHLWIWACVRKFLREDSDFTFSSRPYKVHVSNAVASQIEGEIPDNDSLFIPTKLSLAVGFPAEVVMDYLDKDQMERVEVHESLSRRDMTTKKSIDLQDCLNKFVEREQLGTEDLWYCSKCKQRLQAYKKMDIWSVPDVLILHLKRFSCVYVQTYHVTREKIEDLVSFPVQGLDLSEMVRGPISPSAPPIYDLYAVSEHSGSLGGGHYTAVARNPRERKWYSFNDSSVQEIASPEEAISSKAYVLFYRRRQGSLKWAGAGEDMGEGGAP